MNWHELKPGDSIVSESFGDSYAFVKMTPSKLRNGRMTITMLNLHTGVLYEEDIINGPIHFFHIFLAEGA